MIWYVWGLCQVQDSVWVIVLTCPSIRQIVTKQELFLQRDSPVMKGGSYCVPSTTILIRHSHFHHRGEKTVLLSWENMCPCWILIWHFRVAVDEGCPHNREHIVYKGWFRQVIWQAHCKQKWHCKFSYYNHVINVSYENSFVLKMHLFTWWIIPSSVKLLLHKSRHSRLHANETRSINQYCISPH